MNQPHIVHVIGTPKTGGAQINLLNMLQSNALRAFRHSIVCLLEGEGAMRARFESAGAPVYFCPMRWPPARFTPSYRADQFMRDHFQFAFPFRLARLLKKIEADLVHTHVTHRVLLQASAVLRYARLPWVWTLHGLYRARRENTSDWDWTIRTMNARKAAATAVTQSALDDLTRGIAAPNRRRVIPNGIDLAQFLASPADREAGRARLGISPASLVFGTAGRLIPVKRHDLLIRAAALLLQSGVDAHFIVAGEGELSAVLQSQIAEMQLNDRVHLCGFQPDMPRFLSALDVFVLTSDSEAQPLALIEACAAGLPWIAAEVGGLAESIWQGNGLLVPPDSPERLADAMRQMTHAEIRREYSQRSRQVAENFSRETTCAQYADLYRELLGN